MTGTFEISPEPSSISPPLCPGTYRVKSCETKEAVFSNRVAAIQKIMDEARQDVPSCFDASGYRKIESRCASGFPKTVSAELASSLEFDSFLVEGRNPATYSKRVVNSCPELVEFLSQTLVGCVAETRLGLVSPVSPEIYCHSLSWRPPDGLPYHPENAQLPDASLVSGAQQDVAGIVPIGTDLGYAP